MSSPAAPPRAFRAAGPTEALRVVALGTNLVVIALLFPIAQGGVRSALDVVALLVPLVPLAIGAAAIVANRTQAHRTIAIATLLFAFPVALAGAIATRADLADRDAWGALGMLAAAASLLAFGAVAADACARPIALRTSTAQSLGAALHAPEPTGRRWLRRALLATTMSGAILAAVFAPALASRATLLHLWGEAADEATVLAALIGTAAGAGGIAALVGPRLRAPRAGELPSESQRALRVSVALLLASLALVGLLLLRVFDRPL